MKKKIISMLLVSVLTLSLFSPMVFAAELSDYKAGLINEHDIEPMDLSIANGELRFYGGQTDKIVFSEISRTAKGERAGHNYNVKAIVKVGGQKYTSGWKLNYAYIDKDRVWYADETSHYDYEALF